MKFAMLIIILFVALSMIWARISHAGEVPRVGQPAPPFQLPDQFGKVHALSNYQGRWVVLYFYPKDDTPGCTQEACTFRDDLHSLNALGAQIIGVSVDNTDSHADFAKKYHLPFPLLADKDGKVADRYGALLNLVVAKFAHRYTFLIDPQGKISRIYLAVNTSRHAREVVDDLMQLTKNKAATP